MFHKDRRPALAYPDPAPGEPPARVMFVDHDESELDRLREAIRRRGTFWTPLFVPGGAEALTLMSEFPVDVVVANLEMAAVLEHLQSHQPGTVRIAASPADAVPRAVARAASVAHRFVAKPYEVNELSPVIERSLALRRVTERAAAYGSAAATGTLPSRPGLHVSLLHEIAHPAFGADSVAALIETDAAMTAKVLSLANSALNGFGRKVTRVAEAVVYLGTELIRSLTLTGGAFGRLAPAGAWGAELGDLQAHATRVARIVGAILPAGRMQQDAVTAARLHDIGQIVLMADDPEGWRGVVDEARRRALPLAVVEAERFGVTHAAVGAHLLSLWGLPDTVVDAVGHHHDPGRVASLGLDAVTAVHIADALADEVPAAAGGPPIAKLDEELIDVLGLGPQLQMWRYLVAGWEIPADEAAA